jgi:fucose 4-O-acetylase-like acetyltransferase
VDGKRLPFLDFAKGVLIVLVTVGHAAQFIVHHDSVDRFWSDPLFKGIYLFHMPLFMVVSGFLSSGGIQRSALQTFLSEKARTYLVPIAIWALLYQTAACVVDFRNGGLATLPWEIFNEAITRLWFLWALFGCLALTALTRLAGDAFWPLYGAMTFLVLLLPEYGSFIMLKFMFPFFQVGYLLSAVRFTPIAGWKRNVLFALVAGITAAAYALWDQETYIYESGMTLTTVNVPVILLRFIGGFAGSTLAMMLLHQVYARLGNRVRDAVAALGRDSIYVYIIQTYFFILLNRESWRLPSLSEPVWSSALIAIGAGCVVAIGCWVVGRAVSMNLVARKLLFGKVR